ncbi:MAG: sugar phosphate isomerase/epimerase [Anaerolineae bacterium]|nr:sugar phosphate isomerase/epimerase [Anaerolineae bacterium]
MENIVVSPCSDPEMTPEEAVAAYARLGYRKFEVFTGWGPTKRVNAFDMERDPAYYLELGRCCGMRFTSAHLPPVKDDLDLARAVQTARFAQAIGAGIVIFKATSRPNYIKAAGPFLDAIQGLGITPVLQNHAGAPLSTLDDYREVLAGIRDPRMKTLLEVGQFHSVGTSWQEGYDLLGDSVALVHIKDQIGRQSVPFGKGEIDLPGLFRHMRSVGYTGDFVVEMEVADRENTLQYLAEARDYLQKYCLEGS